MGRKHLKKKGLNFQVEPEAGPADRKQGKAAQPYSGAAAMFVPPEAFGGSIPLEADDLAEQLVQASAWDVAIRYHEFKAKASFKGLAKQLRKISAEAILDRAREVLGSVVHPMEHRSLPWSELPSQAEQPDLDLEETLENAPLAVAGRLPVTEHDIWMSHAVARRQGVVLSVDTSLSMTGEKLALTAVALAVVLLQFPDDPIGIVAFENEAKVIKEPFEKVSVGQMIERFIDVPAQGYTHLEDGLKASLKLVKNAIAGGHGKPASTVLLTDGKYTAGRDPAYLAEKFPHLVVLKMGKERASLELCRELARKGQGTLREVGELEALPSVMYAVVKDLLRGRSLA